MVYIYNVCSKCLNQFIYIYIGIQCWYKGIIVIMIMMKMIIYNDDNSNNKHNNIIYIWLEYNGKWDIYQLWLMICLWGYTIKHWNVCHAKKTWTNL